MLFKEILVCISCFIYIYIIFMLFMSFVTGQNKNQAVCLWIKSTALKLIFYPNSLFGNMIYTTMQVYKEENLCNAVNKLAFWNYTSNV